MLREIRLFTHLESVRLGIDDHQFNQEPPNISEMLERSSLHDGLPKILGYKIKEGHGELLMTNGGSTIDKWEIKCNNQNAKFQFVNSMLRQLIPGLKRIHSFGYSHGDLKPSNICARKSRDGSIKFTLIDLGMSTKLIKLGEDRTKGQF